LPRHGTKTIPVSVSNDLKARFQLTGSTVNGTQSPGAAPAGSRGLTEKIPEQATALEVRAEPKIVTTDDTDKHGSEV
jgi:hypothetical protein